MAEQNDNGNIRRKPPLFPANFVTLAQLKDRWNREQERKQREKEEQEKQQKKGQKKVEGEEEAGSQRVKGEPINRRNQSRRYERRDPSRKHEKLEAKREGLKNQEKEKLERWREKSKKEDPAKQEDEKVIGGEEEAPLSQTVEREEVPRRREWWPRGVPWHFRPSIQNASAEIENNFGVLPVNAANIKDRRYSFQKSYHNRGRAEFGRDYGRFHHPGERNSRNAGMMWEKKGEVGDRNANDLLPKRLD